MIIPFLCHFKRPLNLMVLAVPLLYSAGAFSLGVEGVVIPTATPSATSKESPILELPPLTAVAVDRNMRTVFSPYVERFYNLVTEIMKTSDKDRSLITLDPIEVKDGVTWYLKADLSNGADYQSPRGRYQMTLKMNVAALKTTRPALVKRVMSGDLLPLRQYTEEVFAEPGAPAIPREQQLYYLVNRVLSEVSDPKNIRAPQPLSIEDPKKFNEVSEFVQRYDQALAKLPSFSGIVFRGTALELEKVKEMAEQESGSRKEPVLLKSPIYTSTTLDIADAMNFLRTRSKKITDEKMPTLMVIDGIGKLASIAGQSIREEEIVIPRNSKLQVLRSVVVNFAEEEEEKPWHVLIVFARQLP